MSDEDGGEDMLAGTFSRGAQAHTARILVDALKTHEGVHAAVNGVLLAAAPVLSQKGTPTRRLAGDRDDG